MKSATGPASNYVCYCVGAVLLDLKNPRRVLARTPDSIMEPQEYYEKHGLSIPNDIFPTGNVVVDNEL
ncbi:MAG TPA: hypothetical protein VKA06_07755 [Spirochaetia bacterium]|nr:hypothetical protein [Spirochaetia bacterium]